jgi:hypothetical protein
MGATLLSLLAVVPSLQVPAGVQRPDSGLVLAKGAAISPSDFDLGSGGVAAEPAALQCGRGSCTTPGGVVVECREQGVRLGFPTGRELLFAPDGRLHLRDGSFAGPFPGGVELRLADGAAVRIDRGGSRRAPLTEVLVEHGGSATRIWERTRAVREPARPGSWFAERLWCLGDGGVLYRAIALGPLVTLERVLAPRDQEAMPRSRLLLHVAPVLDSLGTLLAEQPFRQQAPLSPIRQFLLRGDAVFVAEPGPPRIQTSPPRFSLMGGYELQLTLDGARLRMGLYAGRQRHPFAEWQLGYGADVRQIVVDEQPGTTAGPMVRVAAAPRELAARPERNELAAALAVVRNLGR